MLLCEYEQINVLKTFVRKLLHENGIFPSRTWKGTKKRAKDALKITATQPSNQRLNNKENLKVPVKTIHLTKEKKKYFDKEVQMDAFVYLWFGDRKSQLHAAIDNSTGTIPALYFDCP